MTNNSLEDSILVRVDLLFRRVSDATRESRSHEGFSDGMSGAGGIEVGSVWLEASDAEKRQSDFERSTSELLDKAASLAARDSAGNIRLTITFVPDLTFAGVLVSREQVAKWAERGVELALDAQPSESWIESRFPPQDSSSRQAPR